ncbi:MAG: hypothetical protein I4N50_23325, partial [Rhizobium sp.]|nr:hypothetical protein [Rhizobium sp.]
MQHSRQTTRAVHSLLSRQSIELDAELLAREGGLNVWPQVEKRGLLFLQLRRNRLVVTAGAHIGLIPLTPAIWFDVRPKLPVSNLGRVLEASQRSLVSLEGVSRHYLADHLASGSIVEFIAANLWDAIKPIFTNGFLKEFTQREEYTSHPRGKLNVSRTLKGWAHGQFHRVHTQRFEQTANVPANRVIKAALLLVLRKLQLFSRHASPLISRINSAMLEMPSSIEDLRSSDLLVCNALVEARRLNPAREYYYRALEIALLLLASRGISLEKAGDDVLLDSFILNFDDLFEEYLRRVLQRHAPTGLLVLDGNKEGKRPLFDDRAAPPAQPDVVLRCASTGRTVIGEIKYKDRPSRDDINQAITYAVTYGADLVVLIHQYAGTGDAGLSHHGQVKNIRVATYAFDLDGIDLEKEEQLLCRSLFPLVKP